MQDISNPMYDASWIKEPIFSDLTTVKKFEEAYNTLFYGKVYKSVSAERKRYLGLKKKIKIFDQYKEKVFESVVMSFMQNVDPKIKYLELNKIKYVKNRNTKEINKIEKFKQNDIFEYIFVLIDIVYTVKFQIQKSRKHTYLIVHQSIKAPFTMDILSLKTILGKWDFKRRFKWFVKNIEIGLTSLNEITMIKERKKE